MSGKIKMEILFGTEPVLLVSPLPQDQAEGAACTLTPNGALSLISGDALLARLEIPDYLRDRLDGRDQLTAVEVENDAPVRKRQLLLSRVNA
jgi:hypothetical protein